VKSASAKSIIALCSGGDPDEADAKMVRIVLAVCGGLQPRGHVIAEMRDIDNCELVNLVGRSNGMRCMSRSR
jgi:hypothetical protein